MVLQWASKLEPNVGRGRRKRGGQGDQPSRSDRSAGGRKSQKKTKRGTCGLVLGCNGKEETTKKNPMPSATKKDVQNRQSIEEGEETDGLMAPGSQNIRCKDRKQTAEERG